jgi:hypothetical protein
VKSISPRDRGLGPDIVHSKPKKSSRKKWVREADKWASLDVRLDGKCVLANLADHVCKGKLECGHLFHRGAYSTRWDGRNLYPVCSWLNIRMEGDPVVAKQLLDYAKSLWGDSGIEELHRLYESPRPMKTWEIQELAEAWHGKYVKHCQWREA